MNGSFWQGQTYEQLIDALGSPADVDTKVLKQTVRETWKYQRRGERQVGLRIMFENNLVVGWEQKG